MIGGYKQAFRRAPKPALIIGYTLIGLALFAIVYYLRGADKPWDQGVAAQLEAGRRVRTIHHVITGMWYGSWINGVILTLLGLALPFLLQPLAPFKRTKAGVSPRSRAMFALAALAAVTLFVSMGLPRLSKSLWGDEEYTVRRSVIGEYERNAQDVPTLNRVSWMETFWGYKKPTNHVLNSVLTRLSHESLFEDGQNPARFHFSEPALRLPAFIASLGAIVAIGYALACLGFLRAGILAMFLLALHPWFLRYGTETRGYALVLLLVPLCLAFLIKAIRRGRWRYWFAYGLTEFLMFAAYPGTFYFLVATNLGAVLLCLAARGGWTNRRIQLGRWLLGNTLAAMLVIQLFTPCYAQLKAYMEKTSGNGVEGTAWLMDNLCYLASGMPWRVWEAGNPLCHALSQRPVLGMLFLTVAGAAAAAGVMRLFYGSLQSRLLLPFFLLPWPLLIAGSHLKGDLLYQWYSLGALIPTIMLLALGVEWIACSPVFRDRRNLGWICASLVFTLVFSAATRPQYQSLRAHSVEPLRESVKATRTIVNPQHPAVDQVMSIGFVQATRAYDSTMYFIRKNDPPEKFQHLLDEAQATSRPLFVNLAMPELAAIGFPEMMRRINDPQEFELSQRIWGMSENTTRFIYQYVGGSPPLNEGNE